jgi:hypothetical protein
VDSLIALKQNEIELLEGRSDTLAQEIDRLSAALLLARRELRHHDSSTQKGPWKFSFGWHQ